MEINQGEQTISITGVMIQDPVTDGITAYFAEFPEVIAQGVNKVEAKNNLMEALKLMLEFKKSEMEDDEDGNVTTESFNLHFS